MIKNRYFLGPEEKEVVVNCLREQTKLRQEVVFALLHGSFLLDGEPFGDIDLAFFVNSAIDRDIIDCDLKTGAALEEVIRLPVGVRVLNRASIPFSYSVLKEGKLLLCRDEDAFASFFSYVLLSYFDFAPYRKRYLKEVLGFEV
ncbi:nucleotidyltransferase domain-containing protein [Desulfovirgula thermocuniculi]|uniref:nucleotidyltransferase domain-containing protein n=1 Tax=Desulfovirgula thermocuniculi TaxID=348842 RepID=UPI0003F76511|nr:nucleotidyltransferase domain-containing protein [Desulfovirgula thermocuniculi]